MNDSSSISLNDSCFLTSSISSTVLPYPVIFAQEAEFVNMPNPGSTSQQINDAPRKLKTNGQTIFPEFSAKLGTDITLVGFNMTRNEALGVNRNGIGFDAGYYFALQERPGQLRFGADASESPVYESWNDLAWSEQRLTLGLINIDTSLIDIPNNTQNINWGESSSNMASILCQQPVLFLVHANDMI